MIYDPEVQTLAALPAVQARRFGEATALTCEDAAISYREFDERTARLAAKLVELGIGRGDRVGILSKESIDSVVLLFAIARAGGVAVPINWRLSANEVAFIVKNSDCRALFVTAELAAGAELASGVCSVMRMGPEFTGQSGDTDAPEPGVTVEDPIAHVYTSGTTGFPKAVELPNESFFAITRAFHARGDEWIGWSEKDVGLCLLPTFHVGGLWWLVRLLASGSNAVLLPQFIGWRAIEAIERHRVTTTAVVPAMIHVMLSEPDARAERFKSLRLMGYGGAPMPPALLERAMAIFGCDFYQVYGLSETGNMAVGLTSEDHRVPALRASVGRPLAGVKAKVVDEQGRQLNPFEVGEICLASPARMRGYWRNPEATSVVLRDGWVHTGDAGYIDDRGYLYVSDRIKDMICSGGEKIWPAEIEAVLSAHPEVREIAVIGVPHPQWGEAIKAVVVPRTTAAPFELRDLRRFGRGRLAEFKLPSSLELVEALPRNAAGKVQKRLLREAHGADASARAS
jgi:acyl-CoA synthetase (AMP-forming)/AMP-acid ligase II